MNKESIWKPYGIFLLGWVCGNIFVFVMLILQTSPNHEKHPRSAIEGEVPSNLVREILRRNVCISTETGTGSGACSAMALCLLPDM